MLDKLLQQNTELVKKIADDLNVVWIGGVTPPDLKHRVEDEKVRQVRWELLASEHLKLLKKCVDVLIQANFNFEEWSKLRPDLAERLKEFINTRAAFTIEGNPPQLRISSKSGDPKDDALSRFAKFVISPPFNRIGRCKHCAAYLMHGAEREKMYCSVECAARHSALRATKERRKEESKKKLSRVNKAIESFFALPADERESLSQKWTKWVAQKAKVTLKFVTQSLNGGRLRWVTIKKFSEESGYTPDAIRSKIKRGDWLEGQVWVKAPDGRILIHKEGYEAWATSQKVSVREANHQ